MLITKKLINDLYSGRSLLSDPFFMVDFFDKNYVSYRSWSTKSNDEGHEVTLNVPGYSKEDLEIELLKNDYIQVTSKDKKINQVVYVDNISNVDLDNVKAKCVNGVLKITLPFTKKVEHKRKISVE